jgi:protein ImuA
VLAVRVLKRRGPPLEAPVLLALPPVLSATARGRADAGAGMGVDVRTGTAGHAPGAGLRAATFSNLAASR